MGYSQFFQSIEGLKDLGLNLFSSIPLDVFKSSSKSFLADEKSRVMFGNFSHLFLFGNGGPSFWKELKKKEQFDPTKIKKDHPLDFYSISLCEEFFNKLNLSKENYFRLYPQTDFMAPLISLGRQLGWAYPSLLPVDLNPVWGPWFAYRALYFVKGDFPHVQDKVRDFNPCQDCEDKPCIQVCSVSAVSIEGDFNFKKCMSFRRQENSPCVGSCFARSACPLGKNKSYSHEQIDHHYRQSLKF